YEEVSPYIKDGVFIDSGVIYDIIDGYISVRFSKKNTDKFKRINFYLDKIKLNNKWDKFLITPHVLAEVCGYVNRTYDRKEWEKQYPKIIELIMPLLKEMVDRPNLRKNKLLSYVNTKHPVVEIGDISIYLATDLMLQAQKKVAMLTKDWDMDKKYEDNRNVLVMHTDVF
ncbi:hypothetical protein KKB40_06430, partial [Patescibacteria group bacterium]|nr:hypothetical protein [Patescibacteria group bacterium]